MFEITETVLVALITAGAGIAGALAGGLSAYAVEKRRIRAESEKMIFETRLAAYQKISEEMASYLKDPSNADLYAHLLTQTRNASLICSKRSYPLLMRTAKLLAAAHPGKAPTAEFIELRGQLMDSLRDDLSAPYRRKK